MGLLFSGDWHWIGAHLVNPNHSGWGSWLQIFFLFVDEGGGAVSARLWGHRVEAEEQPPRWQSQASETNHFHCAAPHQSPASAESFDGN